MHISPDAGAGPCLSCRTGSHIGNEDVDEKKQNGKQDKEQEHDHHTLRCDSLFGLRVCWWLCRGSAVGTTPRVIGHFTPAFRTRLPQHASLSLRCPGTAGRHPARGARIIRNAQDSTLHTSRNRAEGLCSRAAKWIVLRIVSHYPQPTEVSRSAPCAQLHSRFLPLRERLARSSTPSDAKIWPSDTVMISLVRHL